VHDVKLNWMMMRMMAIFIVIPVGRATSTATTTPQPLDRRNIFDRSNPSN
jgi:hypothetical protein